MFIYVAIGLIQVILIANHVRLFFMDQFAIRHSSDSTTEITDQEFWWMKWSKVVAMLSQALLLVFSFLAIIEASIK